MNLSKFLCIPHTEFKGSLPLEQLAQDLPKEEEHKDPIANDIFVSVGNLSNHIVANSASKELTKLRTEVPHYFARSELYHDILKTLYDYRFKLNAHRFVHELFDRVLLNEEALNQWSKPGKTSTFSFSFLDNQTKKTKQNKTKQKTKQNKNRKEVYSRNHRRHPEDEQA